MNILPLHAAPQFTQRVIDWIWNAFGEGMPRAFFQSIVEHSLTPGKLPLTFIAVEDDQLLGRGRNFTAVASYNDSMAAGAMGVLNDNGIEVPGEISLIGFDDVLVSRYVRPRLTTVRYPIVTMATQAAELALALAEHRPPPEITHLFSPTLVRRHSVVSPAEAVSEQR